MTFKKGKQELFSIRTAAEILGISYSSLEKKIRDQEYDVPYVWIGNKRMMSDKHIAQIKKYGLPKQKKRTLSEDTCE